MKLKNCTLAFMRTKKVCNDSEKIYDFRSAIALTRFGTMFVIYITYKGIIKIPTSSFLHFSPAAVGSLVRGATHYFFLNQRQKSSPKHV